MNKENFLVTLDTAKFLMRLNFHFDTPVGYYYCDGTPLYLDNRNLGQLKKTGAQLWQTTTVMDIHQWLTLNKYISVEPCLKAKRDSKTFVYEVNIINLTECCVVKTLTVEGAYNYAMKKGIEQVVYDLTK